MTATTHNTSSRLSRALPFGSSSKHQRRQVEEEEDWYIPYNGPIEPPSHPRQYQHHQWADERNLNVNVNRQRAVSVGNVDARQSFGSGRGVARPHNYINLDNAGGVGDVPVPIPSSSTMSRHHREKSFDKERERERIRESGRGRERERTDSGVGNRLSSVASIFGFGNSHSHSNTNGEDAGGSGSRREKERDRGSSVRKMPSWSAFSKTPSSSTKTHTSPSQAPSSTRRSRPGRIGLNLSLRAPSTLSSTGGQAVNSTATSDEEYYNSYYSTLLPPPSSPSSPSPSSGRDTVSPHPYVYAANIPEEDEEGHREPRTAPHLTFSHIATPAMGGSGDSLQGGLRTQLNLKNSISTPNLRSPSTSRPIASTSAAGAAYGNTHLHPSSSSSSRSPAQHQPLPRAKPPPSVPKGMDRWLSAETWCDALLFPRPRLRVLRDTEKSSNGSSPRSLASSAGLESKWKGRIVSPPSTPVREGFKGEDGEGVMSRVLAYSRSLVDLHAGKDGEKERDVGGANGRSRAMTSGAEYHAQEEKRKRKDTEKSKGKARAKEDPLEYTLSSKPPRPLSWAQDDLALPSPVPSLAKVLEDIKNLDTQRREWQLQATHSLGNKAARSLSRARSKSLTARGAGPLKREPIPAIDFLAARACLGGQQDLVKVVDKDPSSDIKSRDVGAGNMGTISSKGHSHNSSLAKTLTGSSKSHSRGHSRNDSWSKNALRAAKGAVLCFSTDVESPGDNSIGDDEDYVHVRPGGVLPDGHGHGRDLEHVLKEGGTRVIKLADPAELPIPIPVVRAGNGSGGVSPTPSSAISDSRVGIAISTPPLITPSEEREGLKISHPYARSGFSHVPKEEREQKDSYAGPHPAIIPRVPGDIPDVAMRHKLPPHVVLHPYAHGSSLASPKLIGQPRPDSDVPPPAKMWATLSPGVVREVLPGELANYSPFMSENGDGDVISVAENELKSLRESTYITDTVGLGEALAYAVQPKESRDSGLGTSEDHVGLLGLGRRAQQWVEQAENDEDMDSPDIAQRIHNAHYDARPGFLKQMKMHSNPSTNHTLSSSPLILTPSTRLGPSGRLETITPSPGDTSGTSSSQHSPRPLGSPNDLENFQDLFYKPTSRQNTKDGDEISVQRLSPHSVWPLASSHRRTGSGLTTLARQLSEELELMAIEQERAGSRSISQYSRDSAVPSIGGRSGLSRRPTEDGLEFVLEEAPRSESPVAISEVFDGRHEPISAFQPSGTLPEDVDVDSRASSPLDKTEEDEEQTARFRVGMVESVSTPPATYTDYRLSMSADTTFTPERHPQQETPSNNRVTSGLHPPLSRSSYMTNSTMSRMSNLSDFPVPPKDFAGQRHMSLLSAYFNDAITESDTRPPTPPPLPNDDRRLTFGVSEDAEALMAILSSNPPYASTSNSNS